MVKPFSWELLKDATYNRWPEPWSTFTFTKIKHFAVFFLSNKLKWPLPRHSMFWRNPQEWWEVGNSPKVPLTHFPCRFLQCSSTETWQWTCGFCRGCSLPLLQFHWICRDSVLWLFLLLAQLPLSPLHELLLLLLKWLCCSSCNSPVGVVPFSNLY